MRAAAGMCAASPGRAYVVEWGGGTSRAMYPRSCVATKAATARGIGYIHAMRGTHSIGNGAARKSQRPSAAAGAAVLLALAAARAPFLRIEARSGRHQSAMILGDCLRIESMADRRLAVKLRDTRGRWRHSAECDRMSLIDPAALIEFALTRAVRTSLASAGCGVELSVLDRRYAEQRLRADLHPAAPAAGTARMVRTMLCRDIADRAVLRAACLVFGSATTIADFNDVVLACADRLIHITRETPNLAPLLGPAVRRFARKGAGPLGAGIVGTLRSELMAPPAPAGLARRDWKWLSHQPNSMVRRLQKPATHDGLPNANLPAIRLFAATGVMRPNPMIASLVDAGMALERALGGIADHPADARAADLARLLRLALLEAQRRAAAGQSLRFLRDDVAYLVDWWIDEAIANPVSIPGNATFASLIRRQQRWHQSIILRHPECLQQWKSALAAHESSGLRALPLTDSLMLARAGMDMRHCVASYARDCAAGHTRIFALELVASGERATLELRRRAATWFAGQLKGPCNANASTEMRIAAERLAARYTPAWHAY